MTGNNYRYLSIFMAAILVLSMSVAFVGVGMADRTTELEEGDRYWVGQLLVYEDEDGIEDAEVLKDNDDNEFVTQLTTSQNESGVDYVEIDTESSDFESGSYNLTYDDSEGNEQVVSFDLSEQNLTVEPEDVQVHNEGGDSETELDFSSNRNTYDVNVSSENMSDSDLAQVFSADGEYNFEEEDVEDDYLTLEEVPSDLTVDFEDIDAEEYEFLFEVVDSTAYYSTNITVSEPGDATTVFDSVETIAEGDVSEIVVEYENTDEFDVIVGDEDDVGYELDFTISDLDEDENSVTLLFDSYVAGNGDEDVLRVHDDYDGEVSVNAETDDLSDPLVPETYDLSVLTDDSENDVSTLNIVERSTDGVSTYVLPEDADTDELEDIEQATPSEVVAENDTLVLSVEMTGIYSFLDEDYDLSTESSDYDEHGLYLEVTEAPTSPNVGSSDPLDMSDSEIFTNSSNGVFYVVFDTSSEEFEFDDDSVQFDVEVGLDENNQYIEEDDEEIVEVSFDAEERTTEFVGENGVLEFEEGEEFEVTAETNVAENTEDTLNVRKTGDNSFVDSYDVVVEDGAFSASVDGESLSVGDEFTVRINGETDRVDSVIVEGDAVDDTDDAVDDTDDAVDDTDDAVDDTDDAVDDTDDAVDDTEVEEVDDDTPGFGAVVAFVAIIGAALLAVRRNN